MKAKKSAKEAKLKRTQCAEQVNAAKKQIDGIKMKLDAKRAERTQDGAAQEEAEIIDEEEYRLIQDIKESKSMYKTWHGKMTASTSDVEKHTVEEEAARKELVANFNEWFAASFNEPLLPEAQPTAPPPASAPSDVMDDDEQFEQLQMARVLESNPDSLAFVRARGNVPSRKLKKF